uniref:Uncharacterized protein n=1 Tax=Anguilla anguilla TaxID=7936 RepID=A0A0E9QXA6_ANGAN
MPLMEQINLRS